MILFMQKKHAKSSVPQFGAWDQKTMGATNYSMVFTQARANKKQQKTDLTEVKRSSVGTEEELVKAINHRHGHPPQGYHAQPAHGRAPPAQVQANAQVHANANANAQVQEDPVVMVRPFSLVLI